jgi:hypothetical protein
MGRAGPLLVGLFWLESMVRPVDLFCVKCKGGGDKGRDMRQIVFFSFFRAASGGAEERAAFPPPLFLARAPLVVRRGSALSGPLECVGERPPGRARERPTVGQPPRVFFAWPAIRLLRERGEERVRCLSLSLALSRPRRAPAPPLLPARRALYDASPSANGLPCARVNVGKVGGGEGQCPGRQNRRLPLKKRQKEVSLSLCSRTRARVGREKTFRVRV